MIKLMTIRRNKTSWYRYRHQRRSSRRALFAEELIHAKCVFIVRRQTNEIEQFVFIWRLSSGYYLARVLDEKNKENRWKREVKAYSATETSRRRMRKRGSTTATTAPKGEGRRTVVKQHGDEATKSIILLNNKPCYVRFAKITKTTPLRFVYAAFRVYVGSFIRTPCPAISIHPFDTRNYRDNRPQSGFSALQVEPDLIYRCCHYYTQYIVYKTGLYMHYWLETDDAIQYCREYVQINM